MEFPAAKCWGTSSFLRSSGSVLPKKIRVFFKVMQPSWTCLHSIRPAQGLSTKDQEQISVEWISANKLSLDMMSSFLRHFWGENGQNFKVKKNLIFSCLLSVCVCMCVCLCMCVYVCLSLSLSSLFFLHLSLFLLSLSLSLKYTFN
jgi:hypothetical protein